MNFLSDWYWLADDGRVFASARQAIVDKTDDTYLAWLEAGNTPTAWPRDDSGAQTNAALQWVFDNAGISVRLSPKLQMTFREFVGLFAASEQDALFGSDVPAIRKFVILASAGPIDLTNAEVIADIQACAAAGLITAARAKAILAGQAPTS